MPVLVKSRVPFLRIRKKIGPKLKLRRQTALAIAEKEGPAPKKKPRTLKTILNIQRAKENQPTSIKSEAKARYLCLRLLEEKEGGASVSCGL